MYSTKRNGSNFQDLPLAEMLKPDAQGDAPGDDAPEGAAAPAADAPKVRLGACSGGNTDAIGFMRNLSLDLHFSLYPASSHALVPACSLKFNQLGAYNQHFPWFLIDIIPTAAMVRRCPGLSLRSQRSRNRRRHPRISRLRHLRGFEGGRKEHVSFPPKGWEIELS